MKKYLLLPEVLTVNSTNTNLKKKKVRNKEQVITIGK